MTEKNYRKVEPINIILIIKVKKNFKSKFYKEIIDQTLLAIKASIKEIEYVSPTAVSTDEKTLKGKMTFITEKSLKEFLESPITALYLANHNELGDQLSFEINTDISESIKSFINEKNIELIQN